ncbi:MAG: NAD-dependent epimerase/dehydratase family protein, partial [Bacteroidota bacterium]
MSQTNPSAVVMVTGASGYIASWVIKYLLDAGYEVRASVRSLENAGKTAHLTEMASSSSGTLHLFEADLLEEGSFQKAVEGCTYVIHTASPFLLQGIKDPENQLIRPALEGTKNVLDAVDQTESVQRVVLTSSIVAMFTDADENELYPSKTFDESSWNQRASLKYMPYDYSKTLAEKAAWQIAKNQKRWDLVTINPGLVLGPSLSTRMDGASMNFTKQIVDGTLAVGAPEIYFTPVDVREVANAHMLAAFQPDVEGRYMVASGVVNFTEIGKMLKPVFPKYPLPIRKVPKW